MPHGFDNTSSVGFADTFPLRGRQGRSGLFCTNIAQFYVVRNVMVSAA